MGPQPLEGAPGVPGGIGGSEPCEPSPQDTPRVQWGIGGSEPCGPSPLRAPPEFHGGLEGLKRVTPAPEAIPRAAMEQMSSS